MSKDHFSDSVGIGSFHHEFTEKKKLSSFYLERDRVFFLPKAEQNVSLCCVFFCMYCISENTPVHGGMPRAKSLFGHTWLGQRVREDCNLKFPIFNIIFFILFCSKRAPYFAGKRERWWYMPSDSSH